MAHASNASRALRPAEAISEFGGAIRRKLSHLDRDAKVRPQPEAQLRTPVTQLLTRLAQYLGVETVTVDEVFLTDVRTRPDLGVDVGGRLVGFLELKAPGRGVPPNCRLTKAEQRQFTALGTQPNLVYTDGTSWAHYSYGTLDCTATLSGDLRREGAGLCSGDEGKFLHLITSFLVAPPVPPPSLGTLIHTLAHLSRAMRSEVERLLERERQAPREERPFTKLVREWKLLLFPRLAPEHFADAYAQTVTFALLLSCISNVPMGDTSLSEIADKLGKHHRLMGRALRILTDTDIIRPPELRIVDTIVRVLEPVEWDALPGSQNPYWEIYEDFLEAYDPKLKRESGSYYTPDALAKFMVEFTDRVIKRDIGITRGLASEEVTIVDPAMGTGTFLVEVVRAVASTIRSEQANDADLTPYLRELFEKRLIGFERHAAPYAIAEMRLQQALQAYGVEVPKNGVRCLHNTLDDPEGDLDEVYSFHEALRQSQVTAKRIKSSVPVMAVIANPPYLERAPKRDPAPWIVQPGAPQSLDRFRVPGTGQLDYNLHSTWVYFWRWATWKVFDAHSRNPNGVVTFITPAAYLTSKAFAGMRRYLRETADEGWIVAVTPEGYEPEVSTRVFPTVKQELCIATFIRRGDPDLTTPAPVHYREIEGDRIAKLDALTLDRTGPDAPGWVDCRTGWTDTFVPVGDFWLSVPALDELMPWRHSGVKPNRTWPIAPDKETLLRRWERLILAAEMDKEVMLKATDARTIDSRPSGNSAVGAPSVTLRDDQALQPRIEAIGYHSFDRQFLVLDRRVVDRERAELWHVAGHRQVFLTEQHDRRIREGPGLTCTAHVPYTHHFGGRGGCVRPLYRDSEGQHPNFARRLLPHLKSRLGFEVTPEDLLAYIVCVTAHPGYTERFALDLRLPGVRVPLTNSPDLWAAGVHIGKEILWLHTYGDRHKSGDWPRLEPGRQPVLRRYGEQLGMPDRLTYETASKSIVLGAWTISPVPPEVWNYRIGEHRVVATWGEYRCGKPRHKPKGSPLDDVRPTEWTARFTDDLIALLNVLGRCIDLEPSQSDLLDRICSGPLITASALEQAHILPVSKEARKAPLVPNAGEAPLPGVDALSEV